MTKTIFVLLLLVAIAAANCSKCREPCARRGPRGHTGPCPTVTALEPGATCPAGGVQIQCPSSGTPEHVCNGVAGSIASCAGLGVTPAGINSILVCNGTTTT